MVRPLVKTTVSDVPSTEAPQGPVGGPVVVVTRIARLGCLSELRVCRSEKLVVPYSRSSSRVGQSDAHTIDLSSTTPRFFLLTGTRFYTRSYRRRLKGLEDD